MSNPQEIVNELVLQTVTGTATWEISSPFWGGDFATRAEARAQHEIVAETTKYALPSWFEFCTASHKEGEEQTIMVLRYALLGLASTLLMACTDEPIHPQPTDTIAVPPTVSEPTPTAKAESRIDLQTRDEHGNTPLHIAVSDGNMTAIQELLDNGADANARNNFGSTPLHYAGTGNPEAIQLLLDNGADVDAPNSQNTTPLTSAASGDLAVVQILLDAGANLNGAEFGKTPLLNAVGSRNLPVIQALLDAGADPNADRHNGETALEEAVRMEYLTGVQMLLDNGADPDAEASLGPVLLTALHGSDPAVIQALLDAGADPNAKYEDGETALHMAAEWHNDRPEVIRALLAAGADREAKNHDGKTPLEVAEEREKSAAIELLK